ncbi:MAG: zinc ribbon domain-containing protein [Desulfotignum sp.]|nr:zinc ribbon domain-containing protein [Desulfotignum sp.]MCF8136252.1 zinc ribbon domain-containing protein [Desulfotignum sp.]
MPVYEYQCSACKHIEEAFQKISDAPLTVCPKCHGPLSKIISHSSFHLKGSGWYVTDYGGTKTRAENPDKPPAESTKSTCAASSEPSKKQDDK